MKSVSPDTNSLPFYATQAVTDLMAERIGHGYRVLEDEAVYKTCKDKNIHFEVCPHSSYLTGSIKDLKLPSKRHPVIR